MMSPWWLVSYVALWLVVLSLGFLLLGALRALGLLRWRLEQLEATTPSRLGRGGLKPGTGEAAKDGQTEAEPAVAEAAPRLRLEVRMKLFPRWALKALLILLAYGVFVWLYVLTFVRPFVPGEAAADLAVPAPPPFQPSPFELSHPTVGEVAPEFILRDVDGNPFRLGRESGKVPVLIEFGSFT
jgi:hypothetical protein